MSTSAAASSPAAGSSRSVRQLMLWVMLALTPGTLLQAWLIGAGQIRLLIVGMSAALLFEALALWLRGRAIRDRLCDGSIMVAAWLLVLCLPPQLPLWQLLIGIFTMVMLGKHLYGGLGHNPFNPAMVAYAVLLISFPASMTDWPPSLSPASFDALPLWDGMSGATPLDALRDLRQTLQNDATDEYHGIASLLLTRAVWLPLNLAFLVGGLVLLWQRVIAWHIPVAVLGSMSLCMALPRLFDYPLALPMPHALLSGAVMLGAFFIATDPVTAATSRAGRLIYGVGIGVLCVLIRQFSSYPEGMAFAVLLMNLSVPLIDHLMTGPAGSHRRAS